MAKPQVLTDEVEKGPPLPAAEPHIKEGMKRRFYDVKKSLLVSIIILILLLSLPFGASAENTGLAFKDVPQDAWYYTDVKKAVDSGLINGMSKTTFAPDENITVAAVIKLAACLHQLDNTGKVTLTSGGTSWYDSFVEYAENNFIIARDEWDEAYDKAATRSDFVWIMYKALDHSEFIEINNVADGAIPDVDPEIGIAGPIYSFYRAGILTGSDKNGTFHPQSPITRAEVAAILTRMTDKSERKFIELPAPELSPLPTPMCWITGEKQFVFFTEVEGKAAIVHGIFESEPTSEFISKVERNENLIRLTLNKRDEVPYVAWMIGEIQIDITNLDVDGKVKMRWTDADEWRDYYPAGPTLEHGYNEFFPQ